MTAIEKAAIELHTVFYELVGDTSDWPVRIEYQDEEAATRVTDALNALRTAIREVQPDYCSGP